MTLILGVVTRDFVVQVSDRRVVNGTTLAMMDDDYGKALADQTGWAWGCAGLASVAGRPAVDWLADVLKGHYSTGLSSHVETGQVIADQAAAAWRTLDTRRRATPLTIVGAGFVDNVETGETSPALVFVSNQLADTPGAPMVPPSERFLVHPTVFADVAGRLPRPGETYIFSVPQISGEHVRLVLRCLKQWRKHQQMSPVRLGQLLNAVMTRIAHRLEQLGQPVIGPGRLITIATRSHRLHFCQLKTDPKAPDLETRLVGHLGILYTDRWRSASWQGETVRWLDPNESIDGLVEYAEGVYGTEPFGSAPTKETPPDLATLVGPDSETA